MSISRDVNLSQPFALSSVGWHRPPFILRFLRRVDGSQCIWELAVDSHGLPALLDYLDSEYPDGRVFGLSQPSPDDLVMEKAQWFEIDLFCRSVDAIVFQAWSYWPDVEFAGTDGAYIL